MTDRRVVKVEWEDTCYNESEDYPTIKLWN